MTFLEYTQRPQTKKILLVEIDAAFEVTAWINYKSGLWRTRISPGSKDFQDDNGNSAYWQGRNSKYLNMQSLNVDGQLYLEAGSLAAYEATNKSWFYDESTTDFYIHLDGFAKPIDFLFIKPSSVIGFTDQVDKTCNNTFEGVFYEPIVISVPNLSKKKDALFFGILQFGTSSITFNAAGGEFDNFSRLDLINQPVRVKLLFEGLPYSEAVTIFTSRVDDFSGNFTIFKLQLADLREKLSRKLPFNLFNSIDHPSMDSKLWGTEIPLIFWEIEKGEAYKLSSGVWQFADTSLLSIDSGITVYKEDETIFSHSGTGVDGTFTGVDTAEKLYVTCTQSTIKNGLDTISFILENYENIEFNSLNYDLTEWNYEKLSVINSGIRIGKGDTKTSVNVIEQICIDNNGVFDVLPDGRFTFRSFDPERTPVLEIFDDITVGDPDYDYPSEELLSSVKIDFSKDYQKNIFQAYTNTDHEGEVYGRYGRYKEKPFQTALTAEADVIALSNSIMDQSKFIFPSVKMKTVIEAIFLRILDNVIYTLKRENGNEIISRSRYQVLEVSLDMSLYLITLKIKQIREE